MSTTGIAISRSVRPVGTPASAATRRGMLLAACTLAVAAAFFSGQPAPFLEADPDLARLLRAMALLKVSLVAAALAALHWRLGFGVTNRTFTAYCTGAALMAGGAMLIWQLHAIPAAAFAFHAGMVMLAVAAWRDEPAQPTA